MPSAVHAAMSAETKRKILDAARDEFAAHGLAGARVDRIALAAQTNKQLIYRYFNSKQGLYDTVLSELVTESRRYLDEARAAGLSYSRDFVLTSHPDAGTGAVWARMLGWEGLTDAPGAAQDEQQRRENFHAIVDWVHEDQVNGRVSDRFTAAQLFAFAMAASVFPFIVPQVFELIFDIEKITPEDVTSWRALTSELLRHIA